MYYDLTLIVGLALLSHTHARAIYSRQDNIVCTDLSSPLNPQCWNMLNMTNFIQEWAFNTPNCSTTVQLSNGPTVAGTSTSTSGTSGNSSVCCQPGEPWSTCFLRYGMGISGLDCSQINAQSCSFQSSQRNFTDPTTTAQVHYALSAIFSVNNFFTTYYEALNYAASQANLVVAPIVNEIDALKASSPLAMLFTSLSVGLAFLGAPSIAVSLLSTEIAVTTRVVAQAAVVSLQQAPGAAKALWPSGTDASRQIQLGELQTALGNASLELENRVNNAVQLLMDDLPTFLQFTQSGAWTSAANVMSLPQKTTDIDIVFRTYVTSIALSKNGWASWPFFNQTWSSYSAMKADPSTDTGCKTWDDSAMMCGTTKGDVGYWFSNSSGRLFQFMNTDDQKGPAPYKLLNDIYMNNWADLELLFDGSLNCTWQGRATGSTPSISFDSSGHLNLACVSQLTNYRGGCDGCPSGCGLIDGGKAGQICPFGQPSDWSTECGPVTLPVNVS